MEQSVKKVEFDVTAHTFHIDFAGHVSNIVYLQWMEIGRTKLLEAAGIPIQDLKAAGTVPVLASTEITYRKPLYLGEQVRVEVWLSKLGGATANIEVRFTDSGGGLVASGSHRGVFMDLGGGRPKRISPRQRAALQPFLEE
jgi:acyl-CoA thioester hydrolase